MLKIVKGFLALALAGMVGSVLADVTPPDVLTKNTTYEVVRIVKQDKDIKGGNSKKVYDRVVFW